MVLSSKVQAGDFLQALVEHNPFAGSNTLVLDLIGEAEDERPVFHFGLDVLHQVVIGLRPVATRLDQKDDHRHPAGRGRGIGVNCG